MRGFLNSVALDLTVDDGSSRRSRSCGMTAWHVAIAPNVFVLKVSRTVASGVASTAPNRPMPALLTNTSMGPNKFGRAGDAPGPRASSRV